MAITRTSALNRKQRKELARRLQSADPGLEVMHPNAAGIDVGKQRVFEDHFESDSSLKSECVVDQRLAKTRRLAVRRTPFAHLSIARAKRVTPSLI